MAKVMLKIVAIGFGGDQGQEFRHSYAEKKNALMSLVKYIEKFQNTELVD
jgi:hypothetical protein